jgi:hypothetical protein
MLLNSKLFNGFFFLSAGSDNLVNEVTRNIKVMDLQTTVSNKHVLEDLEHQLAESVSKIKFQKRKLVHIEETRDGKIAKAQVDTEGKAACIEEAEMEKGTCSHGDEPITTHDKAPTPSQQCDDSPRKIGRILTFNCKEKDAPPAQLQSAAADLKEKSLARLSFEAPSFSLGISYTSSQETNSQSQEDLSKKPRRMIFRRNLQLPPCPPSHASKASAQVQEHGVKVKQVTKAQYDSRVIIIGSESQENGVQENPIQVDSQSQDDQHQTKAALMSQYITDEELLTLDPTYTPNVVQAIVVPAINKEITKA